jgi:hypothetical protein
MSLKAGWLDIGLNASDNLDQESAINAMADQHCEKRFWQVFPSDEARFPKLEEFALCLRRPFRIVGDIVNRTTKVIEH